MSRKPVKLQNQIICIFLLTFASILLVNLYIFSGMRDLIDNMDSAYDGNRKLTDMRGLLDSIQLELDDYINTKDESGLNKFYKDMAEYKIIVESLKHEGELTEQEMREKAIVNLSTRYVRSTNTAILSKRSGDIVRYQEDYAISVRDYEHLISYMADLNTKSFGENSGKYERIYEVMHQADIIYSVILALMGIFDILLLNLLLRRLMRPLQELARVANEVGEGNLDVAISEIHDYNEIGIVSSAFNNMITSLKEYIRQFKASVESESRLREKSIRMEASAKEAQLKYLQAQINPHFLFNTLNAGAQLAMLEEADRTYSYILRVADFFRYRIKNLKHLSTSMKS